MTLSFIAPAPSYLGIMTATLRQARALLVRLYVDQVIEAGGLKTSQLTDNIPALMLHYLVWLNREELVDKLRWQLFPLH